MLILNEIFPRVNILQYLNYHRIEGPPAANYRSASTLKNQKQVHTFFFSILFSPKYFQTDPNLWFSSCSNPIRHTLPTCLRQRKKLEYCPASGRQERNTVMQISKTVESFPTFFSDQEYAERETHKKQETLKSLIFQDIGVIVLLY